MVTDLQLLLSIGIPGLLIVLSMLQANVRFNALEKRMDSLNQQIDGIEVGFSRTDSNVDARFNKFDDDLREFRTEHHQDLVAIRADLKQVCGMVIARLEGQIDELSKR